LRDFFLGMQFKLQGICYCCLCWPLVSLTMLTLLTLAEICRWKG